MPKDDLAGKSLDDASLSGANMAAANLSNASLRRADLRGANLAGSNLHDAQLQGADVAGADLRNVDFTRANVDGVDFSRADTTGAHGLPGLPGDRPDGDEVARPGAAKTAALARIDTERAGWDAFVSSIPASWLDLPDACGGWAVKDVIPHLSPGRPRFLQDGLGAVQGTTAPPLDWPYTLDEIDAGPDEDEARVQAVNAWIFERNAHRTSQQALAEATLQWVMLRSIVEAMPDYQLTDPAAFPRLDGQSLAERILAGDLFRHFHDEHEPGLRAWLARMGGRPAAG